MDNNDCAQIYVKTEITDDPAKMISDFWVGTLEYLINVQEVINMQVGKISKINKRAGGNKAVQVGIFQKSIVKNHKKRKNFRN